VKFVKDKYLKGFTIVEIIIVMILSSILIGVALKVLVSVLLIESRNNRSSSGSDKILFTYNLLTEISEKAVSINERGENRVVFLNESGDSISVVYAPSELIIGKGVTTDTIHVTWNNLSIENVDSTINLVNRINFFIRNGNIDFPVNIKKEYPSQILFGYRNK
jgi:prepilin-type N-terminal cleavage/methylation domain-containing protein